MLTSQLVRNNLTESQIESATVMNINRESESVLIRVEEYHPVRYRCYRWVMLSYDSGEHSIITFEKEIDERVAEHWKGFKDNALDKHKCFLNRIAANQADH